MYNPLAQGLQSYLNDNVKTPGMWDTQDTWDSYNTNREQARADWENSLSPTDRAQWGKDLEFQKQQNQKHMNTGMGIAAALIAAGGGAMGGLGGLFGGAEAAGGSAAAGAAEGGLEGMYAAYANPYNVMGPYIAPGADFVTAPILGADSYMAGAAGLSGLEGLGGAFATGADPATEAAWQSGAGLGKDTVSAVGGSNGSSLWNNLRSLLPTGPTETAKAISSLAGLYSNYTQNKNYGNLARNMSSLYGPGSAYEEYLRKELMRRDAMAGRRSQYGPRAMELQAKLAQLASGQSQTLANIYGEQNKARNNMLMSGLTLGNNLGLWNKLGTLFGG